MMIFFLTIVFLWFFEKTESLLILIIVIFVWLILICCTLINQLTTNPTPIKFNNSFFKKIVDELEAVCKHYFILRFLVRYTLSLKLKLSPYYQDYFLNDLKFRNISGFNMRIIILSIIISTLVFTIIWIIFCCYQDISPLPMVLWCVISCIVWLISDILV